MTDSSDLTPQQDAVRRLLAEARHDGPTPPEVIARLDARLADLVADRADVAEKAPVIDLGARRRRIASMGVLAAAAVVVAGVALSQALPQGSEDASSSSADSSFDGGGAEEPQSATGETESDMSGEAGSPDERSEKSAPEALYALPEVALDDELDETLTDLRSSSQPKASLSAADMVVGCDVGLVGKGRQVLVEIDGERGVVVFRAPRGALQEAEVFLCGDAEPLRTLTLPAP